MLINPKIDLIFKKLFGTEENKDILLSLINAILPANQQITSIILKNPYNLSDYAEGKMSILDIKAEDESGVQYDIEMQIKGNDFYGKRVLYYWSKIFGSQIDGTKTGSKKRSKPKKQDYTDLRKCIVISLMDFDFFADARYIRCFSLRDIETNEHHNDLDYMDLYFVELDKFGNETDAAKNTLAYWISFLNNASNYTKTNLPKELSAVKEIQKATEKLSIMELNELERYYYEAQQIFLLDQNTRENSFKRKEKELKMMAKEAKKEAKAAKQEAKKAEQEAEKAKSDAEKAKSDAEKAKSATEKAKSDAEKTKLKLKKSKLKIARKLKKVGMNNATIAEITGLSDEEIKAL